MIEKIKGYICNYLIISLLDLCCFAYFLNIYFDQYCGLIDLKEAGINKISLFDNTFLYI
ncbi:hypothetical protein Runsl_5711 (plasmid) [Runella slithyformis DSM 19594]|uniref:Uncharacterized protein n=1 Tax=Runella slithyformis (strain ATCC 29530 / DSM 19594 / LMG 11500 / NCIMB 11436 / LSU 4) TaxID=761193 RepID=A0A7U3ZRF2_RUNSL|nr:hypothetical protein Runsl_5711 [Runella slithyformis DSM 19594]